VILKLYEDGERRRGRKKTLTERMTITTLYVPDRCLRWIEEHGIPLSRFIREAVEEKIAKESGFEISIQKKAGEIEVLERSLDQAKEELKDLVEKQQSWSREERERKLTDTVIKAISHVRYKDHAECARDLRELKPEEMEWSEWLKEVEDIWRREKGVKEI